MAFRGVQRGTNSEKKKVVQKSYLQARGLWNCNIVFGAVRVCACVQESLCLST